MADESSCCRFVLDCRGSVGGLLLSFVRHRLCHEKHGNGRRRPAENEKKISTQWKDEKLARIFPRLRSVSSRPQGGGGNLPPHTHTTNQSNIYPRTALASACLLHRTRMCVCVCVCVYVCVVVVVFVVGFLGGEHSNMPASHRTHTHQRHLNRSGFTTEPNVQNRTET